MGKHNAMTPYTVDIEQASMSSPTGYLPLARKYRPQTFEELVGQAHVADTLSRAIESKRIGQAYLFAGQRGVGKTSAARILAKSLCCVKGPTPKPCQTCTSCRQITAGSSLDVIEIDGASNRGIDDIRALRETVQFAPSHGAFRIYIIDEVHQITHDAFNALLKTLEEPPAHVKFIFATTAPHKVPPTILSRCQRFDFRRIEVKTVVEVLQRVVKAEKVAVDEAALYAIARASEGSLRDAEVVLEQAMSFCETRIREEDVAQLLGGLEQEALFQWAQAVLDREALAAFTLLAQQVNLGKDVSRLLADLLMHLRHLLVATTVNQAPNRKHLLAQLIDVPEDVLRRLEEQATRTSAQELLMMMQVLTSAYDVARRSPCAQAVAELVLIQLATRDSWVSLDQALERLEQLARALPPSPVSPPRETSDRARREDEEARPPPPDVVDRPASTRQTPAATIHPAATVNPLVAFEEVAAKWEAFLERLGKRKMSLASYLMDARPLGIDGGKIQIGIPSVALHQEVLSEPENMRVIAGVMSELFGHSLAVTYTTLPDLPPPPPAPKAEALSAAGAAASAPPVSPLPVPPIVQEIVNLFDATIVKPPSSRPATS